MAGARRSYTTSERARLASMRRHSSTAVSAKSRSFCPSSPSTDSSSGRNLVQDYVERGVWFLVFAILIIFIVAFCREMGWANEKLKREVCGKGYKNPDVKRICYVPKGRGDPIEGLRKLCQEEHYGMAYYDEKSNKCVQYTGYH